MFSLELPQRGNSNEYTQYTISQYENENHPKLCQICNYGICSKGPTNEFETAVVNEPSVLELLFYCSYPDLNSPKYERPNCPPAEKKTFNYHCQEDKYGYYCSYFGDFMWPPTKIKHINHPVTGKYNNIFSLSECS